MFTGWMNGPLFDEAGDGGALGGGADSGTAVADVSADAVWNALGAELTDAQPEQGDADASTGDEQQDAAEEVDAAEVEDEGQEAQQPEPSADDDDPNDIQPDEVKGKQLFFREQKARRLMAAAETMNRIAETIPDATPDSLANYYQTAVASDEMEADFQSADPARVGKFLDFWVGGQANPQAVQSFAGQFLQRLPHIAPQVAQQFSQQANSSLVRSLYERGNRGDDAAFSLAQNLDFTLRGKFHEKGDFQQRDPYAEERARFEKDKQDFDRRVQADAQRQKEQRVQSIDSDLAKAGTQVIEEALKSVAEQLGQKPQWKHMLRDLTEHVETAINSNPAWQRQFALARERAINDPSGKGLQDLMAMYKQFVAPIVSRNRKAVIENATGTIMKASAQAHQNGQQTAARREPTAAGAPTQRSTYDARMREAVQKGDAEAAWGVVGQQMKETARKR